jgi:hypothetical protein
VANTCGNFISEIETHKWKVVKTSIEPRKDEAADGNDHHMDGLNGLLASRPAEVIPFTAPPVDEAWELEREIAMFSSIPSNHMAA